jgi:hypothetical protein
VQDTGRTSWGTDLKLSILTPVFNEVETVRTTVDRLRNVPFGTDVELAVAGDASSDGTVEVLTAPDLCGSHSLGGHSSYSTWHVLGNKVK